MSFSQKHYISFYCHFHLVSPISNELGSRLLKTWLLWPLWERVPVPAILLPHCALHRTSGLASKSGPGWVSLPNTGASRPKGCWWIRTQRRSKQRGFLLSKLVQGRKSNRFALHLSQVTFPYWAGS